MPYEITISTKKAISFTYSLASIKGLCKNPNNKKIIIISTKPLSFVRHRAVGDVIWKTASAGSTLTSMTWPAPIGSCWQGTRRRHRPDQWSVASHSTTVWCRAATPVWEAGRRRRGNEGRADRETGWETAGSRPRGGGSTWRTVLGGTWRSMSTGRDDQTVVSSCPAGWLLEGSGWIRGDRSLKTTNIKCANDRKILL